MSEVDTFLSTKEKKKVAVALYSFQAAEAGDLCLEIDSEYEVIDDSKEHWWKVRDNRGNVGFIPSNYVKQKKLTGLQEYGWYANDMSRQTSETFLKQTGIEGCFIVRNSSVKGLNTLSLYTELPHPHVRHYHIKQNSSGEFCISEKHCFPSIPDLINYHKYDKGGLASKLFTSKHDTPATTIAGLNDNWQVDPDKLELQGKLGSGQFGVVLRGKLHGLVDVAVKTMKEGSMSEDDFITEIQVMSQLKHTNLVKLYGVCSMNKSICIVTEYMPNGALLDYLRKFNKQLYNNQSLLLNMCKQICKGMEYLELNHYIHRDLAARNCLVGVNNKIKVADFGLSRYSVDNLYTSTGGKKFAIKWAPPEVLTYRKFSSKSDIWAYGVLMWEVFTCGKEPYSDCIDNQEVAKRVKAGITLQKPKICCKEVYDIMGKCWLQSPEERPSFHNLNEQLRTIKLRQPVIPKPKNFLP